MQYHVLDPRHSSDTSPYLGVFHAELRVDEGLAEVHVEDALGGGGGGGGDCSAAAIVSLRKRPVHHLRVVRCTPRRAASLNLHYVSCVCEKGLL